MINFVSLEQEFSQKIRPMDFFRVYNYFDTSENMENMIMSTEDYRKRAKQEVNKFYSNSSNKDIQDASMKYLTPTSVQSNDLRVDLRKLENINLPEINKFFKEYLKETLSEKKAITVIKKTESADQEIIPVQQETDIFKLIESENYLGSDSIFVNYSFTPNLNPDAVLNPNASEEEYFRKLNEAKIDLLERINAINIKDFDNSSMKSIYNQAKSVLSEDQINKFLQRLPPAIRSLMLDEREAKINTNSMNTDPFQNIGTKIAFNVGYLKIMDIQILSGFSNDDVKDPIFRNLKEDDLNGQLCMCRLKPHRSGRYKIGEDKLSLPFTNEYFFLSGNGTFDTASARNLISSKTRINRPNSQSTNASLLSAEGASVTDLDELGQASNFGVTGTSSDIDAMTSNIVTQTKNIYNSDENTVSSQRVPRRRSGTSAMNQAPMSPSTPTTSGGGPGGGMTGGGYSGGGGY
jgi:hypothetical protein